MKQFLNIEHALYNQQYNRFRNSMLESIIDLIVMMRGLLQNDV